MSQQVQPIGPFRVRIGEQWHLIQAAADGIFVDGERVQDGTIPRTGTTVLQPEPVRRAGPLDPRPVTMRLEPASPGEGHIDPSTGEHRRMIIEIDGKPLGCDVCGVALNLEVGIDHRVDLQEEAPYGKAFADRTRVMGNHFYCGECARTAPPSKSTFVYYDPAEAATV